MKHRIVKAIDLVNVPKKVCHHLLGEDHSPGHRMTAGAVVMIIGVSIAKADPISGIHALHYLYDIVGYALHGLGTVPFIDSLIKEDHHDDKQQ